MKKFTLLLLLFLLSTVVGCETTSPNINTVLNDEAFDKKQECFSYKNIVEQELKDENFPDFIVFSIKEIFYSPTLNTCVSHIHYSNNGVVETDQLKDILSGKIIDTFHTSNKNKQAQEKEKKFLIDTTDYLKGKIDNKPDHEFSDFFVRRAKAIDKP